MSTPRPPILTASVRQRTGALGLECRVENVSSTDWGLFARIHDTYSDGCLRLSPNAAYIEFVDGLLRVGRYVLPIPQGLQVAERIYPLAVRLLAGTTWEEEIRLTVPVRVCQPYKRALLAGANVGADVNPDQPKTAQKLELTLGAFPITEDVMLTPVSPAFPTIFDVWPPAVFDSQVLLTRKLPLTPPVMVLDYGIVRRPT